MDRYQDVDQVEDKFLTKFPDGTGRLAYELWTDLAHLHLNWKNYRSLFGTSQERIDLLNWAASSFFGLLDTILLHNVILAIARLTDPARTGHHENACLASLIDLLEPEVEEAVCKGWREQLTDLQGYVEHIREMRNRILAHSDMDTTLKYRSDPLPGVSRAYIEEVLQRLRDLLGSMENEFLGGYTSHQYVISHSDGKALVFHLEAAKEHEGCREREFEAKYGRRLPKGSSS